MDLALLKTFSTVATLGSFSGAAQRLNMTQSTVSQQIARLEQHLGKQLFVRTTRQCRLTHDGDALLERASKVVAAVDEMENAFRPDLGSGTVVVGVVDDSYLFAPLTRALAEFVERRPTVNIEIKAGMSADLLRELKAGNIELALLRVDPKVERVNLLHTSKLVWVAGPDWHVPESGVIPLAVVGGTCNYHKIALETLRAAGLQSRRVVTCSSLEGVMEVVRAGMAVSVVPEGELREGMEIVSDRCLPRLPHTGLKINFSDQDPSVSAKQLARVIEHTLQNEVPHRRRAWAALPQEDPR